MHTNLAARSTTMNGTHKAAAEVLTESLRKPIIDWGGIALACSLLSESQGGHIEMLKTQEAFLALIVGKRLGLAPDLLSDIAVSPSEVSDAIAYTIPSSASSVAPKNTSAYL